MSVTQRHIAETLGLDRTTVGAILRNRQGLSFRPETKRRVLETASRLGYHPNRLARGLRLRRTNTIGLVIRSLEHPTQAEINSRLVKLIAGQGFEALLAVVPDFDTRQIEALYFSHYPEAMIIGPLYGSAPNRLLKKIRRDGYPLVGFDGHPACGIEQVTHVGSDSYRLAIEHLRPLGHRRIAGTGAQATDEPEFRAAAGDTFAGYHAYYGTFENGLSFAQALRVGDGQPTAYVFQDPTFTAGFLCGAQRRGIRVPDEVALVGLGDCKFIHYLSVTLTTVYFDFDEMARRIFDLALSRLRGEYAGPPRRVLMRPQLVVGESSGRHAERHDLSDGR